MPDALRHIATVSLLASHEDVVLKIAFTIGDPIADLLHDDHTPFRPALGYNGPALPASAQILAPWQIPDSEDYGHGNYMPSDGDDRWRIRRLHAHDVPAPAVALAELGSLPAHLADGAGRRALPYRGHAAETFMTDTTDFLTQFSDRLADLAESAGAGVVAVASGGRWPVSGIHWRPGVIVTAEEALERDDGIEVMTADGKVHQATLAGRDPSTDIAVLRFWPDGAGVATLGDAASLRAGNLVLAIGRHERGTIAASGMVAVAGGAWHSRRGGTIDHLIRLDLRLTPSAEGGALVSTKGEVLGMAVTGPRRRALAIPRSTIDRVVDQLLAKGRIARGYLGAGLRPVAHPPACWR